MAKTKIVLSTLLVVGFSQAAMAAEPLNARIGDNYPFLEQRHPIVELPAGAFAFASADYYVQGPAAAQWQQRERSGVNPSSY